MSLSKMFEDLLGDIPAENADIALPNRDRKRLSAAEVQIAASGMVSESDLATFWGVTPRQVRMLAQEGVISRTDSRLFNLQAATRAYVQRLIEQASRRAAPNNLTAEKLRLLQAQAEKVEIQNAATRGELVPAADVRSAWAETLRDVRARMLSLPSRIQSRLPHLLGSDVRTIDSEIRLALEEAAND